jgi:polysaccharide export outer membrane protein
MKFASLSLAAFLAAGCASAPPDLGPRPASTSFSSQLDWSAFPLGPNDVVKVGIYGQPDLGTVGTRVDMEGNLSLPLVGAVKVAGLSTREAREAIAAAHTRFVVDPRCPERA